MAAKNNRRAGKRQLTRQPRDSVCVVAMLKDEEAFVHEWLAYHRIIGVNRFYLYDNDSRIPLRTLLKPHADYVTVIDWAGQHEHIPGRELHNTRHHCRNNQTKAYEDALKYIREKWVAIIDVDEFIVLEKHATLQRFLNSLGDIKAVRLLWRYFGHNGYYDNPDGLITASLTRRRAKPGRMHKSITLVESILSVPNAHDCELLPGRVVDAGGQLWSKGEAERTSVAYVNHYVCRSFINFMSRVKRGEAAFTKENAPPEQQWRFDYEGCLRKLIFDSKDMNELVDEYMLKYEPAIKVHLAALKKKARSRSSGSYAAPKAVQRFAPVSIR